MHVEEDVHGDGITGIDALDRKYHGVDVVEDLGCRDVGCRLVHSSDDLGMEQTSCSDLQSFNP
ncbi:MAG: hypothetical protein M0T78_05640 [Actinomycetota bacterium]|nr:hypothetical protein [Actinomycetota bacterium]